MKIIKINNNKKYLTEYATLCYLEWSNKEKKMEDYVKDKVDKLLKGNNIIFILGLLVDDILIGFISLLTSDGDEEKELTPWYATMYVKENYRKLGYSKILNEALLKEAKLLNFDRVYLKSNLVNYYEKFGAIFIKNLKNGEKLYYIDLNN